MRYRLPLVLIVLLVVCVPRAADARPPKIHKSSNGRTAHQNLAPAGSSRPFARTSFWNRALRDNAPLAPNSKALVGDLVRQATAYGPWINTSQYSTPVYTVGADVPTVAVHVDTPSSMYSNRADADQLERLLRAVPIPADAKPARGTNQHMVIWQPSTDTIWELWIAHKVPDVFCAWDKERATKGWHAAWGARIDHASQSQGVNRAPFGATASGLPMIGGLMRIKELRAGKIDHALAIAIPETKAATIVAPATRTDGRIGAPGAIPEGTRFRLDPDLNLDKIALTPLARAMAEAAQKYGIVVRDTSEKAVVFFGEDPAQYGANPYPELYSYLWSDKALGRFPWDRLQALTPTIPAQ